MSAAERSPRIAIIAGSGLARLAGLTEEERRTVATPFGSPSAAIRVGLLAGQRVAFLARHGEEHRLLPGEINHRANLYALKTLGVERILSASAVGSMREGIAPRDVVVVDQFIDRTVLRPASFFGDGLAAHVAFADPVCPELREVLVEGARAEGARLHTRGTYVCIEGPAFSTRAESQLYRSWGVDVIGMTNLPEAKLAREAEMCYATLALVTDYDCWHEQAEDVSVAGVLENLAANGDLAARVLARVVRAVGACSRGCGCGDALAHAIITEPTSISSEVRERLAPLIGRYLTRRPDSS